MPNIAAAATRNTFSKDPDATLARPTSNMQGIEPSIDLDFEKFFFFFKKVFNLTVFSLNFSALFDEATGHCEYAGILSCGYFGVPLGFSKLLLGASSGPRGPPRKGKKLRLTRLRVRDRSQNGVASYLQGIVAPWGLPPCKYAINLAVARGTVNMQ